MAAGRAPASRLPCIVHLGFAGSRQLFEPSELEGRSPATVLGLLETLFTARIKALHAELGLGPEHRFCGISQIAVGADMLFTRACSTLGLAQRVFLPQHVDAFLDAQSAEGRPDFTAAEKNDARALIECPHVFDVRVVSDSQDRRTRFEDANREIVRCSDLVICLVRSGAQARPGGAIDLLRIAAERSIPALELRVSLDKDGCPTLEPTWHRRDLFKPPALPAEIAGLQLPGGASEALPSVDDFCTVVKKHASHRAKWLRKLFMSAVVAVIGTHILATICSALALAGYEILHGPGNPAVARGLGLAESFASPAIPFLLGAELILLLSGLILHQWLHASHTARLWAIERLVAEISRSVRSLGNFHVALEYLFLLQLRPDLRPLLHTLNVLHLHTTWDSRNDPWKPMREQYVQNRLLDPNPKKGQIAYYREHRDAETAKLKAAHAVFIACSVLAIAATILDLVVLAGRLRVGAVAASEFRAWLGVSAIVLPVLAVGALSWSAAGDYEARVAIFGELIDYLGDQTERLKGAPSAREFTRLVMDTERRLLGETAEWFTRRTFTTVT